MASSRHIVRAIWTKGGRTTVKLEPEFWQLIDAICLLEGKPIGDLIDAIDLIRGNGLRASAIRVFALQYCCTRWKAGADGRTAVALDTFNRQGNIFSKETPEPGRQTSR